MTHDEAQTLAIELMEEWGVADEWEFVWLRSKRKLGHVCVLRDYSDNIVGRQLGLSRYYVEHCDEDWMIKDTILHEIAHIKAGLHNGHNHVWKSWCLTVGALPNRCKQIELPHKWEVRCNCCGSVVRKYQRKPTSAKWGRSYHVACGPTEGKLSFHQVR